MKVRIEADVACRSEELGINGRYCGPGVFEAWKEGGS